MEAPGIEPPLKTANPLVLQGVASTTALETYVTSEANPAEAGSQSQSEPIQMALDPGQSAKLVFLARDLLAAAERGDADAARAAHKAMAHLLGLGLGLPSILTGVQ